MVCVFDFSWFLFFVLVSVFLSTMAISFCFLDCFCCFAFALICFDGFVGFVVFGVFFFVWSLSQ